MKVCGWLCLLSSVKVEGLVLKFSSVVMRLKCLLFIVMLVLLGCSLLGSGVARCSWMCGWVLMCVIRCVCVC